MAGTSVLKLKVDDKEYNSSLKQAQQGLQHLGQALNNAGKSFTQVDKSVVDYVRSIGQMEAQSKTARGRIGEMSSAFIELSLQYKNMSDEVKSSDVGKALSESMEQLKQRTVDAKEELDELNKSLNNVKMPEVNAGGGGLFAGLGDKMSGALQVFAGNMMTKAAGAVANLGSEIFSSVQQGVELAKQGEGIRIAFERLGRGDILDGLRQATHGTVTDIELMKAAVKFNDFKLPLDELGTMLAFAQQKAKDTGQSVDYMVDSIVTGLGRKSLMILDNLGLSATEVKDRMAETGDMTKAVGAIIREQMSKAGDYVETAADRAAQANVSLQNKMEELGRKFAPLKEASDNMWTSMKIGIMDVIGGPLTDLLNKLTEAGRLASAYGVLGGNAKVSRMTSNLSSAREGNRQSIYQQQQQQFWKYINPREQQIRDIRAWQSGQRGEALQGRISAITEKYGSLDVTKIQAEVDAAKKMLADYQQAAKQILQPIKQEITPAITTSGGATGGSGGGRSGGGSSSKGFDISSIAFDPNKAMLAAVKAPDEGPSEVWKAITEGAKEAKSEVDNLTAAFEKLNEAQGVTVKDANKETKNMTDGWRTASIAIGTVGNAMSELKNPAIDIMTVIGQSIATIALAYAQNLANDKTTTGNIWAFIAAAAASTISMITTIASIHSATGYAHGGIVKGNSYSGDNIYGGPDAMVNAGELVLTKAQQGNLASQLQEGGMRNMNLSGRIRGTDIILSVDRTLSLEGKQLLTWGR